MQRLLVLQSTTITKLHIFPTCTYILFCIYFKKLLVILYPDTYSFLIINFKNLLKLLLRMCNLIPLSIMRDILTQLINIEMKNKGYLKSNLSNMARTKSKEANQ